MACRVHRGAFPFASRHRSIGMMLLVVGMIAGCHHDNLVMTDPEGRVVVTHSGNASSPSLVSWAIPAVFVILGVAAFLHAGQSRSWCLALLGLAALLMAGGVIAGQLGERPMWGATLEEIASGRRAPVPWLTSLGQGFTAIGFLLAGIGGIVALVIAIRRRSHSPAE